MTFRPGDSEYPKQQLLLGARILDEVIHPLGFAFQFEAVGKSSGGWSASGSYRRDDRRVELHFRGSLGMVAYWIGDRRIGHVNYMHALGVYGKNHYPNCSNDPLDSFRELAKDIDHFCQDFTIGNGTQFKTFADELERDPAMFSGFTTT